ncbi:sulfite exporter TauE/SafE family protein [Segetibacter aerophilus]|uniref:Membrane protein n=1 Tax=Segetibacter aerophilus TaxID=670293 RepID=A0A512BJP9_9BACT|nr:sulfite exporter TauE/SafE family protein [Segetibacter aerophilus]GEO12174.1 membrane protein [Segetibacter aerophilus]
MTLQLFISALALGGISSFHCVGMCGVFAFSIPTHNMSEAKKVLAILLYNFGRITTYSILGLLFGLLGRQISLAGFQQWFSIIAGVMILTIVIQSFLKKPVFHLPGYQKMSLLISKLISKFLGKPSLSSIYFLGAANGLLPCGLVYMAITGALAAGTVTGATGFMAAFGLGTLPAMFLLSYFRFMIGIAARNFIRRTVPFVVATMGLLLIVRGLNLNIPYLSPAIAISNSAISCH